MYKYPNVDKLLSRRTFLLGLGKGVLFSSLFFRLIYLQLFKSDQYKVLADKNRISLRLIPPLRGSILDRNDNILALNKNNYNMLIEGTKNISEINETIEKISRIIFLSETEIKKHLGTDYNYKYPYLFEFKNNKLKYIKSLPYGENYFENKALKLKINKEIFFNLLKEVDKTQILTSYIGSVLKMLFYTSIIGIFEFHNVSYTELKSIIMYKNNDITIPGIIWLLSQILVIFLRLLQFYSCTSIFHKKKEKNFWPIIFLLFILLPFLISTVGIGNPRYRIPIEPVLFLLTIIGIKNLEKKIKNI